MKMEFRTSATVKFEEVIIVCKCKLMSRESGKTVPVALSS
ncbi:hypothetical protein APHWI1_1048 [Anaplasma phagocytophilum str. ApWI1]|nr:hypothetical protein YYU_00275 [Anaplasma phagocytophilum str. HZ2]AGR80425.1 hypothetical protein WSQ_00265 [Anaplasma phagocytophilum str. JM]AGR81680.1 hypothetical protein YYY_00270 [Anaplasma phagocytophilum str. Dog2]KJV60236.1 hypothetical protein APHWEB_0467 [Anaplasma phagocytophilum str. Webster]KJV83129.1 hypothetical protein APHHGE2_0270 [Anaplasma phagocytophilum str. HGE2]KJV85594.1 hypothetical protein APHWI1_1048 [Anaplasma phagocytophilum str. ApWI1]KJZ98370.1 hypothetical